MTRNYPRQHPRPSFAHRRLQSGIEKEFTFLKEATRKNVENFQSSLNLQQTYSAALCSHINNIYNKLVEIQQQFAHPNQHMNTGDVIQIEVPDFDPDIDEALPIWNIDHPETQGSTISTQKFAEKTADCRTPASLHQDVQDIDWPDAIPVEIPPQPNQNIDQNISTPPTRHEIDQAEIPQLETDPKEDQLQDLQTYLTHHNTYEESQQDVFQGTHTNFISSQNTSLHDMYQGKFQSILKLHLRRRLSL